MNQNRRTSLTALAAGTLLQGVSGLGFAQTYPARAVHIVVPYPPGGPTDIVARGIGQKLAERLRQPFVIENKPGAGGNIGAEAAAKAPPDGYTLLLGTTAHAINPWLFKNLNYDFARDFVPIALLTSLPLVAVVPANSPVNSIADLIALAKAKAGGLPYGSSGNGQSTHMAAELFKSMAGVGMTHVPYKGSAPALTDLAGGQVAVMFDTMLSAMPQVRAGRLRAIGVTSLTRAASAPEIPTIAESGLSGYEVGAWNGLLAHAGTPDAVVAALNRAVNESLRDSDLRQRFATDGAEVVGGTADAFAGFIRRELDKWRRVVQTGGIKLDA
jgi:tripartite-type tricarboxylate transporter receptor subunit TctC